MIVKVFIISHGQKIMNSLGDENKIKQEMTGVNGSTLLVGVIPHIHHLGHRDTYQMTDNN